ncbi:MAG: hypothetical protein ACO1TE_07020 [Prosthecobacter sp.]
MTTGSIGSHRAFMGVSLTLCACLTLVLFVGWRYYFEELNKRNTLIAMAARDQARSADLEKMGLSIDAGKSQPDETAPDATRLVLESQKTDAPASGTPALYPAVSSIKELPLQETSEEVVAAVALLEEYWATPAWRDRLRMVVDPERVSALMKDFYETQKAVDPVPTGLISKARYNIDGTDILYFRYNGSRASGTLEVAMRRGNEGRYLVDWESLVGYGEMAFAALREKRPAKPVVLRVFARQFEYYNFEFSDAAKYYCVKLSSENGEQSIYGYVERGTALGDWLAANLATTGPSGAMGFTVKVAFPPNAESNQCVHLLQVVASRWIVLP